MPPQVPQTEFIAGREVPAFPTPVVSDKILTEYVNTQVGGYAPLDYGTAFDAVEHTAFRDSYPSHVLVFQGPADINGYFVKRIWASNRVDQDTYNYSISYAYGNTNYPTYTRIYVVPRDGYVPLAPLSADPVDPDAKLISEQLVNQVEPQELSSKYVKVVRVYETVPGPVVTTYDFDPELKVNVVTTRQIVLSSDVPIPDTLTLELRESPRDESQYTKLRIKTNLVELPATKVEFDTGSYQFPALVFDIDIQKALMDTDEETGDTRSEVIWTPDMRNYPNVQALLRVTTSFHTAAPIQETLFEIPTRNLIYRGISFQIGINNVLSNEITCAVTFENDTRYGNLSESHTFAATTLSASGYSALIGTWKTIGCQITRYRGSIWIKKKTELFLV